MTPARRALSCSPSCYGEDISLSGAYKGKEILVGRAKNPDAVFEHALFTYQLLQS